MKYNHIHTLFILSLLLLSTDIWASSHREAPLIANDPLADNTDLYAFRSPDDPNTVTIIANYIPGQLPHGGPNYYTFGENVRYEINIDNNTDTDGDDVIYRATFAQVIEDPTTFFNIRLGAENLKTTYTLERSIDGGASFETIVTDGVVPPNNIGPRSIQSPVGAGAADYEELITNAITTATTGETVFCGPADDPFYVDLAGVFDLGDLPRQDSGDPRDGLECYNVHTIALQIPISTLQKDGKSVDEATDILDGEFAIGVWAAASRPALRTLNAGLGTQDFSGDWVQVSRIGMPLTNEAVIPIGSKDEWNRRTPYNENPAHFEFFYNPELALYMDDDQFGSAVPAFAPLRVQTTSLAGLLTDFPGFDFTNGGDGAFVLKGSDLVAGTALDDAIFGTLLLPEAGKPRSLDLWPIFHTGVPNFPPYQLAAGKEGGNPLTAGKPFINNFLPNGGDMLRLNMAVPTTDRNSDTFSALGLISAAVTGLTDPDFANADLEFIPNMDGFPNGRRLEDDVTRIELQAVSGAVLAAVGLWYDDYDVTNPDASPVTDQLLGVLTYTTGVEANDKAFKTSFPYVASPHDGTGPCSGAIAVNNPPVEPSDCSVELDINIICDAGNGEYSVVVVITGGTPPYDITGSISDNLTADGFINIGPIVDGESYSVFVVDSEGCEAGFSENPIPCTKVPVELIGFTGEILTTGNQLNWTTAAEVNNDFFVLERSVDGATFNPITRIEGKGTTSILSNYTFLDKQAPSGQSYYRLIQTDADGTATVSGVLSLTRGENNGEISFGLESVYPMPIVHTVNIDFVVTQESTVDIKLYNLTSQIVQANTFAAKQGKNTTSIDINAVPAGVYFLHLQSGTESITTKILKK